MPKGVYDRSKAKKKASTEKTTAVAAAPALLTKRAYKKAATTQLVSKAAVLDTPTVSQGPHDLYVHLSNLTAARTSLSGGGADHNPQVLGSVDAEIQATITNLRTWREAAYPAPVVISAKTEVTVAKPAAPAVETAKAVPVAQQAAPAPYVPPTPPAPLPFTPQAVQDVLKHTS